MYSDIVKGLCEVESCRGVLCLGRCAPPEDLDYQYDGPVFPHHDVHIIKPGRAGQEVDNIYVMQCFVKINIV